MSDISNYAASIDTTRLSNTASSAISSLVIGVSALTDKPRALPLLQLLGEFVAKASQAGL